MSLYESHGLFPNGKPLDWQSDVFWSEMTTMQRMIVWEMHEQSGDNKTGEWIYDDEAIDSLEKALEAELEDEVGEVPLTMEMW